MLRQRPFWHFMVARVKCVDHVGDLVGNGSGLICISNVINHSPGECCGVVGLHRSLWVLILIHDTSTSKQVEF